MSIAKCPYCDNDNTAGTHAWDCPTRLPNPPSTFIPVRDDAYRAGLLRAAEICREKTTLLQAIELMRHAADRCALTIEREAGEADLREGRVHSHESVKAEFAAAIEREANNAGAEVTRGDNAGSPSQAPAPADLVTADGEPVADAIGAFRAAGADEVYVIAGAAVPQGTRSDVSDSSESTTVGCDGPTSGASISPHTNRPAPAIPDLERAIRDAAQHVREHYVQRGEVGERLLYLDEWLQQWPPFRQVIEALRDRAEEGWTDCRAALDAITGAKEKAT